MNDKSTGRFVKGTHWRKKKPYWERDWLYREYHEKNRTCSDIADEFGVTANAIHFWIQKHGIKSRSVSETRKIKHWGAVGSDNPMWNKKGELNPNWKGGISPERQAFYESQEWKSVCSAVWKRDRATCQRCFLFRDDRMDMPFCIHHIVSFAVRELRCELSNLVLLCEACHHFVHSRRNVDREFLPKE